MPIGFTHRRNPDLTNGDDAPAGGPAASASDGALDTPLEVQFDRVVTLAGVLFDAPITALLIVDSQGNWFRTSSASDAHHTARELKFCQRAISDDDFAIVFDAQNDQRFADMAPILADGKIRFGACAPLHVRRGKLFAHMCIISPEPRSDFSTTERKKLKNLADIVCLWIELSKHVRSARTAAAEQIHALREANSRIKNSLEYATLLREVQSTEMPTDKLAVVGIAAWRQYTEASGVVSASMRSLRERMTADEYRDLIAMMPGFGI